MYALVWSFGQLCIYQKAKVVIKLLNNEQNYKKITFICTFLTFFGELLI